MSPASADNIVVVAFTIVGMMNAIRIYRNIKTLRWVAALGFTVLVIACISQLGVVFQFNRWLGGDIYEISADGLAIMVSIMLMMRRHE